MNLTLLQRRNKTTLRLQNCGAFLALSLLLTSFYQVNAEETTLDGRQVVEQNIVEKHPVKALPGKLDDIEVFNSNSPEIIKSDGILLSTFPPEGMDVKEAHLNHAFKGRLNVFLHHINNRIKDADEKKVQLGLIVKNDGKKVAHLNFASGASYLSQPDAPFIDLPPILENDAGNIFAGPGDRVASDIVNRRRDGQLFPIQRIIQPGESAIIFQAPIPVAGLKPPLNGRTALFKLSTDEPLYAALVAKIDENSAPPPKLDEWLRILKTSGLVQPREKEASAPGMSPLIYGRVSGVQLGTTWNAELTTPGQRTFDVSANQVYSAVVDTVEQGTFGTGQIQSAPLVCRYPDTAYSANGNYGVWYKISIPLRNMDVNPVSVAISLDTPTKTDNEKDTLRFIEPPPNRVFFRGTVRVETLAEDQVNTSVFHLVEHKGEEGQPLSELKLNPKQKTDVTIEFVYPADATPPQVLTIRTDKAHS
jgi:hypothetical protein